MVVIALCPKRQWALSLRAKGRSTTPRVYGTNQDGDLFGVASSTSASICSLSWRAMENYQAAALLQGWSLLARPNVLFALG